MNPNDLMRERLRKFDPAQHTELSDEQRAEIARVLCKEGPALIRRARRQSLILRVGAAGMAAAAMLALVILPLRFWTRSVDAVGTSDRSATSVPKGACATDPTAQASFTALPGGRKVLDFGRARAVAEADSIVSVAQFEPCQTTFALARGTLTVHARDLGGGELEVRTEGEQVIVRGTLFRVEAQETSVRVAVEHGRVTVNRHGKTVATVYANQAARIDARGAELTSLSTQESEGLRASVTATSSASETPDSLAGAPPDVPPTTEASKKQSADEATLLDAMPARRATKAERADDAIPPEATSARDQSPEQLFAEAEARWRRGDKKSARSLYRRVGASQSPLAETAWLRMARLELDQGNAKAALSALAGRKKHLSGRDLGAEAAWLEVEALAAAGRYDAAESAADTLIHRFPKSPQATAAQRLLSRSGKP